MNTIKFSGKSLATSINEQLVPAIAKLAAQKIIPRLAIIQVGGDEASTLYAQRKIKTAEKLGLLAQLYHLDESTTPETLLNLIEQLNIDPACHGILVEQPLPRGFPKWLPISPEKDLDGATIYSLGALMAGTKGFVPATAAAAFAAIKASGVPLAGCNVTIIGRSLVIGKPLALLLTGADATVTLCHSKTKDLAAACQSADLIVAATGCPALVKADMVKRGVYLIDVGTTPTPDGLKGDIDPSCYENAAFYTPVPGGVGPVTVAILLQNLVQAAASQHGVII